MRAAPIRLAGVALALTFLAPPAWGAGEAELYGRPLRGLSTVPPGQLARHVGKTVATRGCVETVTGPRELVLEDAGASVRVTFRDGRVELPASLVGARATVEGAVVARGGGVAVEATGAEVTRAAPR